MNKSTIYSDVSLLHPKLFLRAKRLRDYLIDAHETGRTKTRFEIFETFRSPLRQADLITKRVTKAGPWQSAHQFGMAVDFVPYLSGDDARRLGEKPGWSWSAANDYDFLKASAPAFGLSVPIAWDLVHVELPHWKKELF